MLKPIDEQFLITCRKIDWGTGPNVLMGGAVMAISLVQMGWRFDVVRIATFLVTFACGVAITYSFMLILTSLSVWMVRNQSLMEMWWLFSSLARYPKEIFRGAWAEPLGVVLHVLAADPAGRQRPGERDGQGARSPHDRLHDRGDRGPARDQPAVLAARAAVVSQRQQLTVVVRTLSAQS